MKKVLIVLFALLLITGCSNNDCYSQISNDEVIFTGPKTSYKKSDLYKSLKVSSLDEVETDILEKIADNINIDMSDVEKEANDMIDMYEQMGYLDSLISYYGSKEAFIETYVTSAIPQKLAEIYVDDNYDTLVKEDLPIKMQVAYFDSQEVAEKFLSDVNSNVTFDTAAINNGYTQTCQEKVYLDSDTSLPIEVKSYINDTNNEGLSTIITATSTSSDGNGNVEKTETFYVLNIISRNPDKQDYILVKAASMDENLVKEYMFSKHKIEFFDQDIYKLLSSKYEALK